MRPLRLVLAISSCLFTILVLSYFATKRSDHVTARKESRFRTMFDWRAPSSLFPPSAIISLTDDNSTFFLARPANFGPVLPSRGLSGQLWIGSGFGEEELSRGGVANAEGELGCSDVPGWSESGGRGSSSGRKTEPNDKGGKIVMKDDKDTSTASTIMKRLDTETTLKTAIVAPSEDDGTDDHLHQPATMDVKSAVDGKQGHADIQSLQESAEIDGKVVLLSRGGCGFLEKVKWVQRRGGTALIVGDNIRGGPLVTMYARGDTSNVSIPALFTSHTTAHLLSSLMPAGGLLGDIVLDDPKKTTPADKPTQLSEMTTKSSSPAKSDSKSADSKARVSKSPSDKTTKRKPKSDAQTKRSWLRSIFSSSSSSHSRKDTYRPPSSGRAGWVMQTEFDTHETGTHDRQSSATRGKKAPADGFKIGVQDWRDPDLVGSRVRVDDKSSTTTSSKQEEETSTSTPQGGSITPGSGEYGKQARPASSPSSGDRATPNKDQQDSRARSWLGRAKGEAEQNALGRDAKDKSKAVASNDKTKDDKVVQEKASHEGLWVTLQPTNMSSSPFFDTLLVLVVSPLVTLTVVYALLLLRSRIRRRRWRAPKSVVERLPVRTYQTIASSTGSTSSAQVSPPGTPPSPSATTPLLHSGPRPISQRPRSRTTGEVPMASSSFANRTPANLSLDQIQEKREAGLMEWRRKYGGKQRECVVCLEEYVDGISRVMSLPCGHEFHAECITPWLTTRRRTCPICKGDVVRSLARSEANTPTTNTPERPYDSHDDNADEENLIDDIQQQALEARNDDPATAQPLGSDEPLEGEETLMDDLEQGVVPDRNR